MALKNFIVSTSINPWTEAYQKFSELEDWTLVIVADKKTPEESYISKRCVFLDCEAQELMYPELSSILDWNTVDRRNLGFLYAYESGADIVAMVDDDNIPYEKWGKNVVLDEKEWVDRYEPNQIAYDPIWTVNIYGTPLWHRGYPIEVPREKSINIYRELKSFLVQADFWNEDPDIDAFLRLGYFNQKYFYEFKSKFCADCFSPFNMQNTFVHRKALKHVISIPETGRMCDIWGAYYFQAHNPGKTVYAPASVQHIQERSWDSICDDMEQEILGYRYTLKLLKRLKEDPEAIHEFITPKASKFIKLYQERFD